MSPGLSDIVLPRLHDDGLALRMTAFYADVDRAVASHQPVCRNRGVCCRFQEYGHKLYVSTAELVFFARSACREWRVLGSACICPYQLGGLCSARPFRPLGCRVFFCDPEARDWQMSEYERFLAELKEIGIAFGVDYRYVEWLSALRDLTAPILQKTAGTGGIDSVDRGMID